ncbi:MAG: ParB/RepB/Spo0J family partition protein [Ruminococcus sp.]|nr:ParB/RepB/Spo0J family partition protein [Ruminococcus sp.]
MPMNIKKQGLNFEVTKPEEQNILSDSENQIVEIANDLIIENNDQHFKIHDDTVDELAERIAVDGQLTPCLVAPLPTGKYELIDGRHRRRAVIKAGLTTTKCIIRKDLNENQLKRIRLTSNLIRNNDYLPSELAFAYKELFEIDGTNMTDISKQVNMSKKKIYRYIRLTNLIKPLLDRVDNSSIPLIAAVELSYLTDSQQKKLFEFLLNNSSCSVTTQIAREIKCTPDNLNEIFFSDEKYDSNDNMLDKVDNLSTNTKATDDNNEMDNLSIEDKTKSEYTDITTLSPKLKDKLCNIIIYQTRIDKEIVYGFFTQQDTHKYLKELCKRHFGISDGKYIYSTTQKQIEILIDGKKYVLSFSSVDTLIREYLRKYYTPKKLANLYESNEED